MCVCVCVCLCESLCARRTVFVILFVPALCREEEALVGWNRGRGDSKLPHASLTSSLLITLQASTHTHTISALHSNQIHTFTLLQTLFFLRHSLTHLESSRGGGCFDSWARGRCFRLQGHEFRVRTQWRDIVNKERANAMNAVNLFCVCPCQMSLVFFFWFS